MMDMLGASTFVKGLKIGREGDLVQASDRVSVGVGPLTCRVRRSTLAHREGSEHEQSVGPRKSRAPNGMVTLFIIRSLAQQRNRRSVLGASDHKIGPTATVGRWCCSVETTTCIVVRWMSLSVGLRWLGWTQEHREDVLTHPCSSY